MGHKVHPKIMRIQVISKWASKWYADKREYTHLFHRDLELKQVINSLLKDCGISNIEIERSKKKVVVHIHTSKPGVVIGSQGSAIEDLRQKLAARFGEHFEINIVEIKKPEADATLVGELIALQIKKRVPYRRAVKQAVDRAREAGAKGVKILCAGRLNGVEIARREFFKSGNIPLQTFRADVSYCSVASYTTYGKIGIKVWIYKGEIFKKKQIQKIVA